MTINKNKRNASEAFLEKIEGIPLHTIGQPPATIRNNQLQGVFYAHIFAVETNEISFTKENRFNI